MFDWLKRRNSPPSPAASPETTSVDALIAQADVLRESGQRDLALAAYLQAHKSDAQRIYPLYWLATLEEECGRFDEALAYCQRALALDAGQIGLLLRAASITVALGDDVAALENYQRVAALDPDAPGIDAHLADQYCRLGQLRDGVEAFDRALARTPDDAILQSNRLFVLNYSELLTAEQLFAEHQSWGSRHEAVLRATWHPFEYNRDPGRRLKVGLVSADLRAHAVANFVEPWLRAHDRNQIESHCFDVSADPEDATTASMRGLAHSWHRVADLGDAALAARIRAAGIDILLDLSGHTRGNRLLVFARRPAPVQATWLGYLNTTGLTAMDYRLTDDNLDPPGMTAQFHTETLARLAAHACFAPASGTPEVVPSQVGQGHPLTFGSVNQWPKVSASVKDLWAKMLKQLPEARLFVIARGANHPAVRSRIVDSFVQRGVRAELLEVFPFMPTAEFLRLLGRVDIALDSFPYGGGTTTMQCLWMGVPVLTIKGRVAMSRNSVGILDAVGLADLAVATPADYVQTGVALGRDVARLVVLRQQLRGRMAASRVTDAGSFARDMERALRDMWITYCNRNN